ncbi:AcrR family transcriptional regulator [Bradyrhizobium sp. LB14.3]|uniref:hypothetical protein n=1 Tax=Bradyrhizobium sp. LB14.3 TaxID=3156328 RepID=UPI003390AB96
MRKLPKTEQPASFGFDKPAKERLIEAAQKMFRLLGIRAANGLIAQEAHSNMETLVKYFGNGEALISYFIKSLIAESETVWEVTKEDHPGDAEAQLRGWLATEQESGGLPMQPQMLLARTAAELYEHRKNPQLSEIEQYWQAERRRVVGLCRSSGLRDHVELADKLLLMVHGARNERNAYGAFAPSRLLQQAGNELLVAHGDSNKVKVEHTVETKAD